MDFYIIRIKDNEHSVKAAERCLKSLKDYYSIEMEDCYFDAITPKDKPQEILAKDRITNLNGFIEPYSRWDNVIAAFTSHYSVWKRVIERDKPAFIFEHDAVITNALPMQVVKKPLDSSPNAPYKIRFDRHYSLGDIVNIGAPSYGKFNTPANIGINPLTSKRYFPGAHAYYVTPRGAKQLTRVARENAGPTDTFINLKNFPDLQEWYPWSAMAKDDFTTIQNTTGCQAKHRYHPERYKLVQVR